MSETTEKLWADPLVPNAISEALVKKLNEVSMKVGFSKLELDVGVWRFITDKNFVVVVRQGGPIVNKIVGMGMMVLFPAGYGLQAMVTHFSVLESCSDELDANYKLMGELISVARANLAVRIDVVVDPSLLARIRFRSVCGSYLMSEHEDTLHYGKSL